MLPVLVIIVVIAAAALFAFRWFERYRYTDAWRKGELRSWAFGFLMWFGGIFGHRVPPPPQARVEFATKAREPKAPSLDDAPRSDGDSGSGGASLADEAPDEEE